MFTVYGLRTLEVTVCVCECVRERVRVFVASEAFVGYVTKTKRHSMKSPPLPHLAAANLFAGSEWVTFRTLDTGHLEFRLQVVTKQTKYRKKAGEIIIIKTIAICCRLCMCCQTIMLQPGAQFSCYTQVYQVLLMLCPSDVR